MYPSPRSHHVIFNTCAFANRQLALLLNRLFYSMPPVNNHRRGSSRLIRAPVLVADLLTSLGVTPPPCPVTPAEYLPNQPYGAHADSNRIVNMQLCVVCKSFYGCSASMLITVRKFPLFETYGHMKALVKGSLTVLVPHLLIRSFYRYSLLIYHKRTVFSVFCILRANY